MKKLSSLLLVWAALCLGAERPNVLLIISDDQFWRDFGFMGHGLARTPNLDRLAEEGAVFPNGYVPSSLCRPSLATLLTGLYPHQHRITGNDPPKGVDRREMLKHIRAVPTLPRMLGEAGYASLQTGKFWEGRYSNAGFTDGMTTEGRHGGPGLKIGRETMQPIYDFIRRNRERPWFVWYAPMMPHTPHNPPETLLEKYLLPDRHEWVARYYAMVEWFDETCGELLEFLRRQGLSENTLVVFLVDNGWIQGTKRSPHPSRPGRMAPFAPKSKASPYDGGLRTPVILRWPGRVKPGRYYDLVSSIDIAPTILAAAGVERDRRMPGLNLLDVATGKKARLEREAVYGAVYFHDEVSVDEPAKNLLWRWVRRRDWKLIAPKEGEPELYNLLLDPFEEHDRAAAEPELVEELRKLLEAWWPGR